MKPTKEQWQNAFPEPSVNYRRKVEASLASLPREKEKYYMKINKRFAVPVMALILVLALGTGLIATGTVTQIISGSSSRPTYTEVPTEEQLKDDLDFVPSVPSSLGGEYAFEDSVIGKEKGTDDEGNVLTKQKFISTTYSNGTDQVVLGASPANDLLTQTSGTVVEQYNGVDLYYDSYTAKYVPVGYEMTEQDLADEAAGTYVFSEGEVEEVETEVVQNLTWISDGIAYDLLAMGSPLTQQQLTAMAKDILSH